MNPIWLLIDEVHRPARPVAGELREVEGLGHDALAGERRVAVQQKRQDPLPRLRAVPAALLLGAHHALDDRVDGLEVRRVRRHRDPDRPSALGHALASRALVVLHVSLVGGKVRMHRSFEAGEDALGRVADDVGHDVQAAPMGHAERELFDPAFGGALDQPVEQRDRRVAAFDRVAALSEELRPEKALEFLRRDELLEDLPSDLGRQRRWLRRRRGGESTPSPRGSR